MNYKHVVIVFMLLVAGLSIYVGATAPAGSSIFSEFFVPAGPAFVMLGIVLLLVVFLVWVRW